MIERIHTYRLQAALDEAFAFSQWSYGERQALLVQIVDDSGAVGWGECYGPAEVTQAGVHSVYAPLLIGWDPLRSEAAWQHCWRNSLDFARKGVLMGALSGIDMALLDLKGHLLKVSAAELLGGRQRDVVPGYATGMYFRDRPDAELIDEFLEEAAGYVSTGFRALKIKVGRNLDFDLRLIQAMRESFPKIPLMADSNHAFDLPEAVRVGRCLAEHGYHWFEEPLSPEHGALFRRLAEQVTVPLATGECEQTRWGFRDLLNQGGVQILQPDLAYCGGPTEAMKIRALASAQGINVIPHCWGTQLNLACTTHFAASTYVEPGRAERQSPWLELDQTANPLRNEVFSQTVSIEGGMVKVPTGPGLGVEVDAGALRSFVVATTSHPG